MSISAREASKIFNSRQLSALADGDFSFVEKVAKEYLKIDVSKIDLGSIFERTYKRLGIEYRSEYYFKNTIAIRRLLGRHSLNTSAMLSEFRVGKSKADCVIVNGKTTCYEIKSEFDTLNRLDKQLDDYLKIFDEVYVVCTAKNLKSVLSSTDEHIGVLELTSKNYLSEKRPAIHRQKPIDIDILARSLRKEEYLDLVYKVTGRTPNVPNSRLFKECLELLKSADPDKIATSFIEVLKEKRFNDSKLIKLLPSSLINAAISYQFSNGQIAELKRIFNMREENRCISLISEESSMN